MKHRGYLDTPDRNIWSTTKPQIVLNLYKVSRTDTIRYDQCTELDGKDPALAQWSAVSETDLIESYANESLVSKTMSANYIHCFPGSIIVDKQSYNCPMDIFRLQTNHEFKTAKQRHMPLTLRQNSSLDMVIEAVHAGHFRDDSGVIQHVSMFERLRDERQKIHRMTTELQSSIVIDKNSFKFKFVIIPLLTAASSALTYCLWMIVTKILYNKASDKLSSATEASAPRVSQTHHFPQEQTYNVMPLRNVNAFNATGNPLPTF